MLSPDVTSQGKKCSFPMTSGAVNFRSPSKTVYPSSSRDFITAWARPLRAPVITAVFIPEV